MGTSHNGSSNGQASQERGKEKSSAAADLAKRLDLPDEVTTTEAAEILGCCKHTVLQYLVEGLLEWRNAAPPSSERPVYRLTLRSVLELRLGYRRGNPHPPLPVKASQTRRRSRPSSDYQPKHLRRKKPPAQDAN
jgi:hypothetical protein